MSIEEILSITSIKEYLLNFIQSKPDYAKWKDFYESSTGTLLIELLATIGAYSGYQALMARREAYLPTAQIGTSATGIANTLGYPVYRGKNDHVTLTILPTETLSLNKFDIIGTCQGKDVVCFEPSTITYGEEIDLEVVIGDFKTSSQTVPSKDIKAFKFAIPNVSEDYLLELNGTPVPTSREIIALSNDRYTVLTNSTGLDVLYLNRPAPDRWQANAPYNNLQVIKPDFTWRSETPYTFGDKIVSGSVYFKCIVEGTSGSTEPSLSTVFDSESIDGSITWKCIGTYEKDFYYKNIAPGQSFSGDLEPVWVMEQGITVTDNEITWLCVRDASYSKYEYTTGDILTLKYIELSQTVYTESDVDLYYGALTALKTLSKYTDKESISNIKVNAPLYHETRSIIKAREDYRKAFKELLPNVVDTNGFDVSPAVIQLTYAKDHTTTLWEASKKVYAGALFLPSRPNGFIYRALTEGYTANRTIGVSGPEVLWPDVVGEKVEDNQITWVCITEPVGADTTTNWQPETPYNINTKILANGYEYMIYSINVEPLWPKYLSGTVVDNDITWECIDTIYIQGYDASSWEVNKVINEGDFITPIVPIDHFYIALNTGTTGTVEPLWPKIIGGQIEDNDITWECYDLLDAGKYQKNIALKKLTTYRMFGVEPPTIKDPVIVFIQLSITLYLQMDKLLTYIRSDLSTILEQYEKKLGQELTLHDVEKDLEDIDYVKVARISVLEESKSKPWEPGHTYTKKDVVQPTVANGFYYECYYIRDAQDIGESQSSDKAYTGAMEPLWPEVEGESIIDNCIEWTCIIEEIAEPWQSNSLYVTGDTVTPGNGYSYRFTNVTQLEPLWPEKEGVFVVDFQVYWIARKDFIPSCSWDEYYIIGTNLEVIL